MGGLTVQWHVKLTLSTVTSVPRHATTSCFVAPSTSRTSEKSAVLGAAIPMTYTVFTSR